jgi:hypothetical protein
MLITICNLVCLKTHKFSTRIIPVDAFAGRSGPSRPEATLLDNGWTPCDSKGVVSNKPGKKKTKFHSCVQNQGFDEDVLKCVNWKKGCRIKIIIIHFWLQMAEKIDQRMKSAKMLAGSLSLKLQRKIS